MLWQQNCWKRTSTDIPLLSDCDTWGCGAPGPCVTFPTSDVVVRTLQTSRSWKGLNVQHRRRRRGRDAEGQTQHLWAEGPLSRCSPTIMPFPSGLGHAV